MSLQSFSTSFFPSFSFSTLPPPPPPYAIFSSVNYLICLLLLFVIQIPTRFSSVSSLLPYVFFISSSFIHSLLPLSLPNCIFSFSINFPSLFIRSLSILCLVLLSTISQFSSFPCLLLLLPLFHSLWLLP